MISEHLLYVDLHSYQVKFCAVCYYSQPTADMNRAKKGSEDKTENILVRLYENTKDKRRRRQRNEADPKHRNPNRRIFLDTATCYRMSSTPRLLLCRPSVGAQFTCSRGSALLINNETFLRPEFYQARPGSRLDMMNLRQLFSKLGFRVETRENLTRRETIGNR